MLKGTGWARTGNPEGDLMTKATTTIAEEWTWSSEGRNIAMTLYIDKGRLDYKLVAADRRPEQHNHI